MLDFLVKSVPESSGAYASLLRKEMELMKAQADYYILHEHLETVNVPMYFHEFAAQAKESGLQFLAEAELGAMSMQGLSADIRNIVRQLSKDLVDTRAVRGLHPQPHVPADALVSRRRPARLALAGVRVRSLYVASPAAAEGTVEVASKSEAKFKLPGGTLTTQTPLIKSALSVLIERWPQVMHFDELLDESMRRINVDPAASQDPAGAVRDLPFGQPDPLPGAACGDALYRRRRRSPAGAGRAAQGLCGGPATGARRTAA